MPTTTELLDLAAGIGQRQATFRFDLIEAASGRPLGTIHPDSGSAPTLTHDTTRGVPRTLTGLSLDAADTAAVDPLKHRVRPFMVIGGVDYPFGTYVYTDSVASRTTAGRRGTGGLADLMFVVAQPTANTVSFPRGMNAGTAIAQFLASIVGIDGYTIAPSSAALGSPMVWPAGTTGDRIIGDLCTIGAYATPYMGNDSKIHVIRSFDPIDLPPDFVLEADTRVVNNSIAETSDLLDAPNVFIVIDNSNTDSAVVGRYDIPATAPHSAANRNFLVPSVSDIQGLGTVAQANESAKTIAMANTLFLRTSLSTPPDPRHDAYNIVRYDDANWLETGWAMPLIEGSEMTHTLQRAYGTPPPSTVPTA